MSKVTIGELTKDLIPFTEKGDKIITVEIVPRKIVENIITYCDECNGKIDAESSLIDAGKKFAYDNMKRYAKEQLRKFEEDRA
jgi:hypothetical protein